MAVVVVVGAGKLSLFTLLGHRLRDTETRTRDRKGKKRIGIVPRLCRPMVWMTIRGDGRVATARWVPAERSGPVWFYCVPFFFFFFLLPLFPPSGRGLSSSLSTGP